MSTQTDLKRQIGLLTAMAMVVGEVIGVGIFLTPAGMAKSLGSPAWLLVVWLVMGARTLVFSGSNGLRFDESDEELSD